jgi:hypothetical protein
MNFDLKEAYSEFAVGVLILFLRIYARARTTQFKDWQGDDWLTIIALVRIAPLLKNFYRYGQLLLLFPRLR